MHLLFLIYMTTVLVWIYGSTYTIERELHPWSYTLIGYEILDISVTSKLVDQWSLVIKKVTWLSLLINVMEYDEHLA